jgi:colicin import membrane protein
VKQIAVAVALCLSSALAVGTDASDAVERGRIREERAQAQRLFEERERTCQAQFVVTSCLDGARQARRETLERLRHQELVLDNASRKQRAAARSAQIREKQDAKDSKPNPMVVRERQAAPVRPPAARASAPSATARASGAPRPQAQDAEQEKRNRATFEAKQREAATHRAEAEQRNAERAKKSKPVTPLPAQQPASAQ